MRIYLERELPVGDGRYRRYGSSLHQHLVRSQRHGAAEVVLDDGRRLDSSVHRRVNDLGVRQVGLSQTLTGQRRLITTYSTANCKR